jgi:PhnB protein
MRELKIHLSFNGNCEEAFEYYKTIFGGEFTYLGRLGDMPEDTDMPEVQEADKNKLMHISLQINENIELM